MSFCPKCGSEYRSGFAECADCLVPLVGELPEGWRAPETERPSAPDLVCVYAADHRGADLVRSVLEGSGIPAVLKHEGSAGYPVNVGAMGEGRVFVRRSDADRALEIVDAAIRGDLTLD